MDANTLSATTGIILSLLFSYMPGLSPWYEGLGREAKQLVMLVALLVTAIAAFGLSCANVSVAVPCTGEGAIGLINAFVAALVANQSTYLITKR